MVMKNESRFYIGQTIIKTRNTIKKKIEAQKEKHIDTRVKTGRKFLSEFKKHPRKQFDSLITENKNRIKDFTSDSKKTYSKFIDERKITAEKVCKGVSSDAKLLATDVKDFTKKTVDKMTVEKKTIKNIEKKFNSAAENIPYRLNLPSRKEINKLMAGVDVMNKKIDKLNKFYA